MSHGSDPLSVEVVRTLDGLLQAFAVRTLVYVGEQNCPYPEEFDNNDFAGTTHLIARLGSEPIGTGRVRWFAGFSKLERISVHPNYRKCGVAEALYVEATRVASRKGYDKMLAYIEPNLVPYWERVAGARRRGDRPSVVFSDREYVEVFFEVPRCHDAVDLNSPALQLMRPEGEWDEPGVLDRSVTRFGRLPELSA